MSHVTAARMTSPIMVGRDRELACLLGMVAHPPALALVDGEAGVGKTRLLHELLRCRELAGFRVLHGRCVRLREPFPFGPLVSALAVLPEQQPPARPLPPATAALRPLLPELGDWLPPGRPSSADPRIERHRVFRAIRELLVALGPTILVLDDVHWLDEGSFELLRFLVGSLPEQLSVVLSARPEDVAPGLAPAALGERLSLGAKYREVRIPPLPPDTVSMLAAALVDPGSLSPEFALRLHERTGGLPFAIEEVLGLLRDQREVSGTSGPLTCEALQRLAVPGAVREPVRERVNRLGPAAQLLVRAAAVLDQPSSESLLAAVAGLSQPIAMAALEEALDHAVLHPVDPTCYDFRHVLARLAVYDAMPHPQRRRMHARAERALRLSHPALYAKLAHHTIAAGRYRASLRYVEAAAEVARQRGDNTTASQFLRDALRTPELSRTAKVRLTVKLARVAALGLAHVDAIPRLREAVADPDLPNGLRGELRLNLGLMLSNQAGEVAAGTEQIRLSVAELRHRPELAARALSGLAVPDHTDGPVDENLDWLAQAMRLLPHISDPGLRLAILVNRATTLLTIGDPAAWTALAELPDTGGCAATREQLSRGTHNFTNNCTQLGHYAKARDFLRSARGQADDTGCEFTRVMGTTLEMELNWATGDWRALAEQARWLSDQADLPSARRHGMVMIGILALLSGDVHGALRRLRTARLPETVMPWHRADALTVTWLARALLADQQAAAASAEVEPALRVIRGKGIWAWAADLAPAAVEARLACGEVDTAGALAEEFADGLAGRDCPLGNAAVLWCRAQLHEARNRPAAALEGYLAAGERFGALPRPYEAARAAEAAARCAAAAGGDGMAYLRSALREYERLTARTDAHRCRQLLRDAGATAPARRGRPRYGRELSPRELEVLNLVGKDHTNREIGALLYVSERTVEGHLARLRAKLGVSSRRELRNLACQGAG